MPGDYVTIIGMNTVSEVISIDKNKAVIVSNNVQITIHKDKLCLSDQKPKKQTKTEINVIRNDDQENVGFFGPLDVRGKRAEDALIAVMKYIDDAIVQRNRFLKILHGTGNGILREVIREFLRTQSIVKQFKDERIEAGGTGITLVELEI
jgi:DNA mismatch repair protein MutS2